MRFFGLLLVCLVLPFAAAEARQEADAVVLRSPSGAVELTVGVAEKLEPAGRRLYYAVRYRGEAALLDSPFALAFKGAAPFAEGVAVRETGRRAADDKWQRYWGRRKTVRDHYNEVTLDVTEQQAPGRTVQLTFRAYDDGVAFRYAFGPAWGDVLLAEEQTGFAFPGNPQMWAAHYGIFTSSQEDQFKRIGMHEMTPASLYGCPLLVQVRPNLWATLTEADLTDWAGMYFRPALGRRSALLTALSPRPDEPDVAVRVASERRSPWRVIGLGTQAGAMLASDLVQNLNDAPQGDFGWVQPGLSSWDRWWSGDYAPEVDFKIGMNTATMKYYVDLAAEMGWEYQLVDWEWYGTPYDWAAQAPPPGTDITNVIAGLDLPELVRYARSKNVKILVWLRWESVRDQMEKAFPLYEKWGIAGVKIDFMDRDDQEMVRFYHRVARLAAQHHLAVDFHGAYKPTGVSRTYPNLITREGVLGNEYNKWSDRITPEHTVTLPFTRGALGEMDFTPGGFRHKTPATFRAVGGAEPGPFVMGTRVHQLAMLVVYESALQVLADSPYNYRISPGGVDFLKVVPATWDDTVVLGGFPGDYAAVARRSGGAWYVAAMGDEEARTLDLDLSFLGSGPYTAEIWQDAHDAAEYPEHLEKAALTVTRQSTLKARLAAGGGGFIARLTPAR